MAVRFSADSEAKQSIEKVEIVNCYYQWQILKHSGKKEKRSFTVSVKTPGHGTGEKATLKGTTGMARVRGSAR
jgi:hypothetical protein